MLKYANQQNNATQIFSQLFNQQSGQTFYIIIKLVLSFHIQNNINIKYQTSAVHIVYHDETE